MPDKDVIQNQNTKDLLRVAEILVEIIETKPLTEQDLNRINYCNKLIHSVTDKQRILNNFK